MGKPFAKELERLNETLKWSIEQSTADLRLALLHQKKPLLIVGSGGSLSACHYAVLLYQQYGMMAKTITPLELHYAQNTLRESHVLFISASGRNNDILFAYKTAIACEPNRLFSLCMKDESPLGELAASVSTSKHFAYPLPTGSDGFLATNSLVAFFGLLCKALSPDATLDLSNTFDHSSYFEQLHSFFGQVRPDFTFTLLYAGWGHPVASDMESKLAEAALGDVLVSDYRNFGHGRHHWFDKRKSNSCIIAIITLTEKEIAAKTFALLPDDIPVLFIETTLTGPAASIDLLIKSFYFIQYLGKLQGIDPGRPGVPDFGSQLYHLNYQQLYRTKLKKAEYKKQMAIIRKAGVSLYQELSEQEQVYWDNAHDHFVAGLRKASFGSVIFDYDGTICSSENRWLGVNQKVVPHLLTLLEKGFVIGIATGRGKSAREALNQAIPQALQEKVIIGYYNCSEIAPLGDATVPNKGLTINENLKLLHERLTGYDFPVKVEIKVKPYQLTIQIDDSENWNKVRSSIIQLIMLENLPHIQILESSHSMDIIDQSQTNKLNIKSYCQQMASASGLAADCLFIGDKGQWPGNDYQLLSEPYTLSVDEVSPLYQSCWNLASPSIKNVEATIYYLSCLEIGETALNLKLK